MRITQEICNAIESLLRDKDYSETQLAEKIGVAQRTVNSWKRGEVGSIKYCYWEILEPMIRPYLPKEEIARPVANAGNSSGGTAQFVGFPIVSIAAAATNNPAIMPIADFLDENEEKEFLLLPKGKGRAGDFAIRICGDSMSPWYPDGTIVLVRHQKPQDGDMVVAVLADGEVVIKYYVDNGDEFTLAPENGCGMPYTFKKSDFGAIRSMYQVVYSIRDEIAVKEAAKAEGKEPSWKKYKK